MQHREEDADEWRQEAPIFTRSNTCGGHDSSCDASCRCGRSWEVSLQSLNSHCPSHHHPTTAAPEILRNQPYGHSVDWWSLGIVAYALLYGSYPYSKGVAKLAFDRSASDRAIMLQRIEQDLVYFPELAGMEPIVAIQRVRWRCNR